MGLTGAKERASPAACSHTWASSPQPERGWPGEAFWGLLFLNRRKSDYLMSSRRDWTMKRQSNDDGTELLSLVKGSNWERWKLKHTVLTSTRLTQGRRVLWHGCTWCWVWRSLLGVGWSCELPRGSAKQAKCCGISRWREKIFLTWNRMIWASLCDKQLDIEKNEEENN